MSLIDVFIGIKSDKVILLLIESAFLLVSRLNHCFGLTAGFADKRLLMVPSASK